MRQIGLFSFLFLFIPAMLWAQSLQPTDDFDVITVPIGPAKAPQGKNLSADTLEKKGLIQSPLIDDRGETYPLGLIQSLDNERIVIHLDAGEAIQLWSQSMVVSHSSVAFSSQAYVEGATPQQMALAFIDVANSQDIQTSFSYNDEIPREATDFSLEYTNPSDQLFLLIQLVGPSEGECRITLERLRVVEGYREIEFALEDTTVSDEISFRDIPAGLNRNSPPSTQGGIWQIVSGEDAIISSGGDRSALQISTLTDSDIVQMSVPFSPLSLLYDSEDFPRRFYAQAYIKRKSGSSGIFSLALFSGMTTSGGYRDIPVADIPEDEWMLVQSPVWLSAKGANLPLFIVQIRGGTAEILVDQISLEAANDSPHVWDSSVLHLY